MKDPSRSSSANLGGGGGVGGGGEVTLSSLYNQDDNHDNPFAEYMWMENEEEFNRQVEEELWEEEFIERCFQEMLEEEEESEWFIPARDLPQTVSQLQLQLSLLGLGDGLLEDLVINSSLNPNAAEFVPGRKH